AVGCARKSSCRPEVSPPSMAAAGKLLTVIDNAEYIMAIELMAADQAHDFLAATGPREPGTDLVYKAVREHVSHYGDERPL
ncbi:aromatic amino acid lyase, partial [Rhizobium leguminosarum]|uniref:aromatic amino acid lyase n=1 Tax=Rhizobium leguminosarum TaxID=384 RepID=UPI003F97A88D